MKVALVGGTGIVGSAAARALVDEGHDVRVLSRSPEKAGLIESLGATPVSADIFDRVSLEAMFDGCDAVVSLASRVPVGVRAAWPAAWRETDRLRTEGVRAVVAAARAAHVRRLVQDSITLVYADGGDEWIDEQSPLDINAATEPACVAESLVQSFAGDPRQGVVLRLGLVVGEDPMTRFFLRLAKAGRPVGLGDPDGWVHLVHTDDLGPAVVAALHAPSGVYNVGAEPVRRRELVDAYAQAVGRETGSFMGPMLRRLSGQRFEPMARSLRVSSEVFSGLTGWQPRRRRFDASWLAQRVHTGSVPR